WRVTWAGPCRSRTGFRESPFACNDGASLSWFPPQRNSEPDGQHDARQAHDERHECLGREPSIAEGDREGRARGERWRAIARESTALDVLDAERIELATRRRGRDDRRRVFEQQVHLLGGLVDRHV